MRDRRVWRLWRRIFRQHPLDEISAELDHHIEERVRDHIARGMDPDSAKRAVLERLGDLGPVREECAALLAGQRDLEERRLRMRISWLDVKLGVRMLAKYPGLSVIAVVGMAVAIAIGAGYFGFIGAMLDPSLPLSGGDRVIAIRNYDTAAGPGDDGLAFAYDFAQWRDGLKSVTEVGAYRLDPRNLILDDGGVELVEVAYMTASGFRLARVPAALGRPLMDEDEREGAPAVLVIAYEEWQRRFEGDPGIIGTTVRLGETTQTIVGVMPEGFRFPINHRYWAPLRLGPATAVPREGPPIHIFGRLSDGFTLRRAAAELEMMSRRTARALPVTHERLRARVMPYARSFSDLGSPGLALVIRSIQIAVGLLLVIVAVNVAILVYARTVARTGEIAVRTALGASRRRVVSQLFIEALVLSGTAAAIGLTVATIALRITAEAQQGELPFWAHLGLSPGLIVYAVVLAVIAAAIAGILPALKATGRQVQSGLQRLSTRGSLQLGRTWTALIVVQVAVAVAALPAAVNVAEQAYELGTNEPARVTDELLRATLVLSDDDATPLVRADEPAQTNKGRLADRTIELISRLEAEPTVSGVTFARSFPGTETGRRLEADTDGTGSDWIPDGGWARVNLVSPYLFGVLDIPLFAGRGFVDADARDGGTAVIVNQTFAERYGGNGNMIGRYFRYVATDDTESKSAAMFQIVGIVADFSARFTSPSSFDGSAPTVYHAAAPGGLDRVVLMVRVRSGDPAAFGARLRQTAAAVDPALRLERLQSVGASFRHSRRVFWYTSLGIVGVISSVLLLSAAGIYAMMAFTVARRRREIGIRSALGASPRRILSGVFLRASAQLGAGIIAGLIIAGAAELMARRLGDSTMGGRPALMLSAVSALIIVIGLTAALGPARRGLAVQPTEALRED